MFAQVLFNQYVRRFPSPQRKMRRIGRKIIFFVKFFLPKNGFEAKKRICDRWVNMEKWESGVDRVAEGSWT